MRSDCQRPARPHMPALMRRCGRPIAGAREREPPGIRSRGGAVRARHLRPRDRSSGARICAARRRRFRAVGGLPASTRLQRLPDRNRHILYGPLDDETGFSGRVIYALIRVAVPA